VEKLLKKSDAMVPEGKGGPQAFVKGGAAAEKANELLVNAKDAIIEYHGACACSVRQIVPHTEVPVSLVRFSQ